MASFQPASDPFARHCALIAKLLGHGKVIPFLGAGVNLSGSSSGAFRPPSSAGLAQLLAEEFDYPAQSRCDRADCGSISTPDLLRVSQYVQVTLETGPLYDKVREVFSSPFEATGIHSFLAGLPKLIRRSREQSPLRATPFPLVVTTNYDGLMEKALEQAGETYDLVFYNPGGPRDGPRGRFWYQGPGMASVPIEAANSYPVAFGQDRPTVLKIHGTIDGAGGGSDGFVITEDDYIEYLVRQPLETLLPQNLLARLRTAHLLFLGYSLRDWNFRVFLRRLWSQESERHKAWAVMRFADPTEQHLDEAFWRRNGVDIWAMDLSEYVKQVRAELDHLA